MNSIFSGRIVAAVFALLLSSTMVIGAVGPAFDVPASSQIVTGQIA